LTSRKTKERVGENAERLIEDTVAFSDTRLGDKENTHPSDSISIRNEERRMKLPEHCSCTPDPLHHKSMHLLHDLLRVKQTMFLRSDNGVHGKNMSRSCIAKVRRDGRPSGHICSAERNGLAGDN